MRNWGIDWAWCKDPNAFWDTQVRGQVVTHPRPAPVQSVRERTGWGYCVCMWGFREFFSSVCARWPTESGGGYSQRKRGEVSVCVCVCVCLAESHRTWHGIFYMARQASAWLTSDSATVTLISPSSHLVFIVWTMSLYPQCRCRDKEMMQKHRCPRDGVKMTAMKGFTLN